jgi:glycosyltransferase involved in cell wall biosynthesis
MKVAVITDIPTLCAKTQYLDVLKKGMEKFDVIVDKYLVTAPRNKIEGKLPLQRLLGASMLLRKIIDYDFLHIQFSFPLGFWYALTKRIHGKPMLVHTHGVDVFSVPSVGYGLRRNLLGRITTRKAWTSAAHIITVCERARKELLANSIPPTKISVLHNGIDVTLFRKQKSSDSHLRGIRETHDHIFLNVASLSPVKNHETLLHAFSKFTKHGKAGRSAKLLLCGEGSLKPKLVAITRSLKIQNQVEFLGFQPHHIMPEIYSMVDAFVLPSLSEAHPWSLLEAMSCGLPAIASSVGGIPDTIQDDRCLFNPHSPTSSEALCDRMIFLTKDVKRRRKIGAANRERVVQRFTAKHHLKSLYQIYREKMH